jgi:hypothetical protein
VASKLWPESVLPIDAATAGESSRDCCWGYDCSTTASRCGDGGSVSRDDERSADVDLLPLLSGVFESARISTASTALSLTDLPLTATLADPGDARGVALSILLPPSPRERVLRPPLASSFAATGDTRRAAVTTPAGRRSDTTRPLVSADGAAYSAGKSESDTLPSLHVLAVRFQGSSNCPRSIV